MTEDRAAGFAALREPFDPSVIGKLPKPTRRDAQKGRCEECGGWHGLPAVHLDYVGHAALTDRLLQVDPEWTWEPMSVDPTGAPAFDRDGGLWIRLTVLGVTRIGYGDAGGKNGTNAVKECIGDALRNAAMRFGCALDLWSKEDLQAAQPDPIGDALARLAEAAGAAGIDTRALSDWANDKLGVQIRECRDVAFLDGLVRRVIDEGPAILEAAS
ncbi:hypothetical protein [Gordonia sp. (in: high G+C Gram-positive bacteria)]|uniref:hypothetical protein n=1 Tax=Gordonia sp. (in: high G+C Gram-positive bacteria) TaxID=84139 RepID=UPI003340F58F